MNPSLFVHAFKKHYSDWFFLRCPPFRYNVSVYFNLRIRFFTFALGFRVVFECIAAFSSKVCWLQKHLLGDSSKPVDSRVKWKQINSFIPPMLQDLLPPHRWVAVYAQFAHEFAKEEGEYVKMSSLLTSLKKLQASRNEYALRIH